MGYLSALREAEAFAEDPEAAALETNAKREEMAKDLEKKAQEVLDKLDAGTITEEEAQELVDHLVMKFRMVKFARVKAYQQLFSGAPVWATLEVGGTGLDGTQQHREIRIEIKHSQCRECANLVLHRLRTPSYNQGHRYRSMRGTELSSRHLP